MMTIGTLGSMGAGATIPLMMFFFTNIIDNYTAAGASICKLNCSSLITTMSPNTSESSTSSPLPPNYDLFGEVKQNAIYLCIVA